MSVVSYSRKNTNLTEQQTMYHQPKYYITDLLNRRGIENGHVILWMIKDFAWIRVWDYRAIAVIGFIATSWALGIVILDVRECLSARARRNRSNRFEANKELCSSFGCLLWLAGNSWWAIGENWDLRNTAGYNDVYDQFCSDSSYILAFGFLFLLIFWAVIFSCEMFGLSKSVYDVRLAIVAEHLKCTGRDVNFSPDEAETLPGYPPSSTYEPDWDLHIRGLPYKHVGLVGIPGRQPHFRTGIVKKRNTWTFACQGVVPFRDYENLIIFWWILKDLAWTYEEPVWAQGLWYFSVIYVGIILIDCAATLILYSKRVHTGFVEIVHSVAMVMWLFCNGIWGWGEMFADDHVPGLSEDPTEAIQYLVPSLFTPIAELPPGAWLLRWVAGWTLLLSILMLIGSYIYIVIHDWTVYRRVQAEKVISGHQESANEMATMETAKSAP